MSSLNWDRDAGALTAVCFDLDGTLVDSEGEAADAIELALSPYGRSLTAGERDFVVGHGFVEIYDHIRGHGGLPLDIAGFEEAVYAARVELFARNGPGTLPGAREVVRACAARWRCALVTGSTRREAELMLTALGLHSAFSATVCAGEYAHGKPSPEPYLRGAELLGVPPRQCIAVEDSTAGIAAARAAGMRCVGVRAGNRYGQDQSAADAVVSDLNEFLRLIENL